MIKRKRGHACSGWGTGIGPAVLLVLALSTVANGDRFQGARFNAPPQR
jgi:hypothetical protein